MNIPLGQWVGREYGEHVGYVKSVGDDGVSWGPFSNNTMAGMVSPIINFVMRNKPKDGVDPLQEVMDSVAVEPGSMWRTQKANGVRVVIVGTAQAYYEGVRVDTIAFKGIGDADDIIMVKSKRLFLIGFVQVET